MRHGLIQWNNAELSIAEVEMRQQSLRSAMAEAGFDALLIYTNLVRSGAVTWATGFTPYWAEGLWLLPKTQAPVFAMSLSARGANWLKATNPTSELFTTPTPGTTMVEWLAKLGARSIGVVEPDRLPERLASQLAEGADIKLHDATGMFAAIRSAADAAERRLLSHAAALAAEAFSTIPDKREQVGDVTGAVELSARLGGAEEVYMAIAPDLSADRRFARFKGGTDLGKRFAVRATIARHGVWLRWTRSYDRNDRSPDIEAAEAWFENLTTALAAGPGIGAAIATEAIPDGLSVTGWVLEAPVANRPLQIIAEQGADPTGSHVIANLTLELDSPSGPIVLAGPLATDRAEQ